MINSLVYAPDGWKTVLPNKDSWNDCAVVDQEIGRWNDFIKNCSSYSPLGFSHESEDQSQVRNPLFHNVHITFAYVLALAAHKKDSLSVLDLGGGLGHYYVVGNSLSPQVELDYHVYDVPLMVQEGRKLNPTATFHDSLEMLDESYDLVMINGMLQYVEDWKNFLFGLFEKVEKYLFLTRVPVIQESKSFVAVQSVYGTEMLHNQINEKDLLSHMQVIGFTPIREFVVGDRPQILNAPEQCELKGWLFRK